MSLGTDPPQCACTETRDRCQCTDDELDAGEPTMPNLGQNWDVDDVDGDWEGSARDQLDTVDFDTELGVELSRDALRVARGDLTKAEFHAKHHERVDAEFGIDDRPTKDDFESEFGSEEAYTDAGKPVPRVPGTDGKSLPSRRGLLKTMGGLAAAGATAGLAGCLGSADPGVGGAPADTSGGAEDGALTTGDVDVENDPDRVQMGMVIDTDRCIACLNCSMACKEENNTDRGAHWPYVFQYEEQRYGETEQGHLTRHCQHCSEPSCSYVCPTQARYKRGDNGIVLTDYDTCVGCKYCQVACPYGVNFLGKDQPTELSEGFEGDPVGEDGRTVAGPPPKGVMGKCTFCIHRQDSDDEDLRGTTACEDDCPVDAIIFGDMHDPDSEPRQHIREKEEANKFKLLDQVGTEPNIVFVGKAPSKDARPVESTDEGRSYEERGLTVLGDYDFPVEEGDDE